MDENLRKQVQQRREQLRVYEATKYSYERNQIESLDDEESKCWKVLYYLFIVLIVSYFMTAPILMLYVGISYLNCDDMFAPWLIIGGVLHICTFLPLFFNFMNEQKCDILFFTMLFVTFIWYIFGFGRIFSGSMNEDTIMDDEVCKWYLYKIPFWLTLMPFILLIPICFVMVYYGLHKDFDTC